MYVIKQKIKFILVCPHSNLYLHPFEIRIKHVVNFRILYGFIKTEAIFKVFISVFKNSLYVKYGDDSSSTCKRTLRK